MPAIRSRSVCPVSDTYHDVENLIYSTVHSFRRKYGHFNSANLHDMLSEAKIAYMNAYNSYDRKKGEFPARVRFVVWHHLMDNARHYAKRKNVEPVFVSHMTDDESGENIMNSYESKNRFNVKHFAYNMSDDASYVIRLLFRLESLRYKVTQRRESEEAVNKTVNVKRRAIMRFLEGRHWTRRRISRVFKEIQNSL